MFKVITIHSKAAVLTITALTVVLSGCAQTPIPADVAAAAAASGGDADRFLIVDCFLPGQLRRLGKRAVFQSARRVAKLPASDCEIRGGEYVAYDRADYRTALNVWLPAAEAGDTLAQTYVGEIYERGLGTAPDYSAALSWYRKAALQGNSRAQNNLGQMYELGRGVAADRLQALNWYRQASGLNADQLAFSSSIDEWKREVDIARAEAASLRQQLDAAQRRQNDQQRSLQQRQRQLDEAQRTLQRARQERVAPAAATVPIKPLDPVLAQLEADVTSARAELVRANQGKAQAEQNAELLKARLGGVEQDNSTLLARIERLQQQTEQNSERQRQELERLQAERERLRAAEERLAGTRRELRQQQAQLAARDNTAVADLEGKVSGLEQELARKQRLIEQLEREMIDGAVSAAAADDGEERLRAQRANLDRTAEQLDDAQRALQQYQQVLDAQRSAEIDALKQQLRLQRDVIDEQRQRNDEVEQQLLALNQNLAESRGRADALAEQKQSLQQRGGAAGGEIETAEESSLDFGGYYALVIGNNRYGEFPNLVTAVNDAEDVAALLRQRYGFEVELLTNVNRFQMLEALNRYRAQLTDRDNFLLYYAGHGELDRVNQSGNWLPVDAQPDSTTNWVTNGDITNIINAMNAKHVMVIADSCYSGTLTRSVTTSIDGARSPKQQQRWLELMIKTRSRTVLTSGGLKPVLDGGGGRNSVFAKNLLRVLRDNREVLEGPILYRSVAGRVKRDAAELGVDQTPEYSPIHYAGDLGAPFLFRVSGR